MKTRPPRPVIGDLVFTTATIVCGVEHIPAGSIGYIVALDGQLAMIDFGASAPRPLTVHGSFVEVLELPDGLDLAYLGDTLQEALLRTVDALQHERQARLAAQVAHLPERLYENGNGRN